jgi:hypothetical protein
MEERLKPNNAVALAELEIIEPNGHIHTIGGTLDLITGLYKSIFEFMVAGKAFDVCTNNHGGKLFMSAQKLQMCTIKYNVVCDPNYADFMRTGVEYRDEHGNTYNPDGTLYDGGGRGTDVIDIEQRLKDIEDLGYVGENVVNEATGGNILVFKKAGSDYQISYEYIKHCSNTVWETILAQAKL